MMLARTNPAGRFTRLAIAMVAAAGGSNGVFNYPDAVHSWGNAGRQLQQKKSDLQRVLGVAGNNRT